MKWKNLPSWIKGGVIAIFIETIFVVLYFIVENGEGNILDWLLVIPQFPFAFGAMFMGGTKDVIIGFIEQYALYFLVGALIGWVNERSKSKKAAPNQI